MPITVVIVPLNPVEVVVVDLRIGDRNGKVPVFVSLHHEIDRTIGRIDYWQSERRVRFEDDVAQEFAAICFSLELDGVCSGKDFISRILKIFLSVGFDLLRRLSIGVEQ